MMSVGFGNSSELKEKYESEAEVKEQLETIRDNLEPEVAAELARIMLMVQQLAIEMCPKRSGALASSISLEGGTLEKSAGADFFETSIYAGNDEIFNSQGQPTSQYALFVHDGTSEQPPQEFLTNAIDAFSDEINACVAKAMREMNIGD